MLGHELPQEKTIQNYTIAVQSSEPEANGINIALAAPGLFMMAGLKYFIMSHQTTGPSTDVRAAAGCRLFL